MYIKLTNSMDESSWETDGHSGSQAIPSLLLNLKVNPVYTFPPYTPKVHCNIIIYVFVILS